MPHRVRIAIIVLMGAVLLGSTRLWAQASGPDGVIRDYYAALQAGDVRTAATLVDDVPAATADKVKLDAWGRELFGATVRGRVPPALNGCWANLKNIGMALEMYSTDNKGRFPRSLSKLTPNYLRQIPLCPRANADTYSATLQVGSQPDVFTVYCGGAHHVLDGQLPNYPQYTSTEGLRNAADPHAQAGPVWKVLSYKILGQRIAGDTATVSVEEVYSVHGYPARVTTDFILVQNGHRWRIEGARMHPDETVAALVDAPPPVLARMARMRGLGASMAVILSVLASPEAQKLVGAKQLDTCRGNLSTLSTALEMYSTDWSGRFPPNLGLLTPNYLRTIPTCPSAGRDTYSGAYQQGMTPVDIYTVFCAGAHHASQGLPPDFPLYTSTKGLIRTP